MPASKSKSGRTMITYDWADDGSVRLIVSRDDQAVHHFTLPPEREAAVPGEVFKSASLKES